MNEICEERKWEGCGVVLARATWRGSMPQTVSTYEADAPMHLTGKAQRALRREEV